MLCGTRLQGIYQATLPKGNKMEQDYIETEMISEDRRFRKWSNTDGTVWYTDLNLRLVGEDIEEAIETLYLLESKKA
jgi:hypothetical protein